MSVSERALRWSATRLGGSSGELVRGLIAELAVITNGAERRQWARGGLWLVASDLGRAMLRAAAHPAVLAVGGLVVALDRIGSSDDSSQVTMAVLLVGCALLGATRPTAAVPSAVAVGSAVTLSHLTQALAPDDLGRTLSAGWAGLVDPLALLILIVPALLAAHLGVATRRCLIKGAARLLPR